MTPVGAAQSDARGDIFGARRRRCRSARRRASLGGAPPHGEHPGWAGRPRTAAGLPGRRAHERRAAFLVGRPGVAGSLDGRGAPVMWPDWLGGVPLRVGQPRWEGARARSPTWLGGAPPCGEQRFWVGGAPPCGGQRCWVGAPACRTASVGRRPRTAASLAGRRAPARMPTWLGGAPQRSDHPGWAGRPRTVASLVGRGAPVTTAAGVWLVPWASAPMRAPRGGHAATVRPGREAFASSIRSSGRRAGGVVVLCLLFCVAAGFPSLSWCPAAIAAAPAWAAADAAVAVTAANIAAVAPPASGWMGCDVRRGERRNVVGWGKAEGAKMRRARSWGGGRQ